MHFETRESHSKPSPFELELFNTMYMYINICLIQKRGQGRI